MGVATLRGALAGLTIGRVMTAKGAPIRVIVELEAASEPIRGSVRTETGERDFNGWIELTAALEDARAATGSPPAPGDSAKKAALESVLEEASPRTDSGSAGAGAGEG